MDWPSWQQAAATTAVSVVVGLVLRALAPGRVRNGLLATAEYIQILEEGAQFQILAEALGGSQPFGTGVLEQQWKMSGLTDEA